MPKLPTSVRHMAQYHGLAQRSVEQVIEPYQTWIAAADARDEAERLPERERLAIALVALGNQERVLVLETRADQVASQATIQVLLRYADALVEGARSEGRPGYDRAAEAAVSFARRYSAPLISLTRHFGNLRSFLPNCLAPALLCCW